MHVSYRELSRLTGKTYTTIKNKLESAGLKPVSTGEKGKAHLWDSQQALEAIYATAAIDGDGLDLNAERAREAKERADKLELQNAFRRKELLLASEVKREWAKIVITVKTKITGLPSRLAAMSDEPDEGRRFFTEATDIVNQCLTDISDEIINQP